MKPIKNERIDQIDNEKLEKWLRGLVTRMVKDAGQRLNDDDIFHIAGRLPSILKHKFPHMTKFSIESAWDKGIFGEYGKVYKITVTSLLSWIFEFIKQQQEMKRQPTATDGILERTRALYEKELPVSGDDFGSFIAWLTRNKIWIDDLFPDISPIEHNDDIPSELRELHEEWRIQKLNGNLSKFKQSITL